MKKIIKSLLVLTLVAVTTVGATRAWFTSNVTAEENEITTGTLMVAVDSTREHEYVGTWDLYTAYNVVRDLDGNVDQREYLEPWTNVEPGYYHTYSAETGADEWEAGNNSVWIAVRNRGTLPLNYRFMVSGDWTEMPRIGTADSCS